jgi:predicted DsbA family dithiol-disulfide isomerase
VTVGLRFTRRRLAISAAVIVAAAWFLLPELRGRRSAGDFDFVALTDPKGFRSITAGEFSSGWDPFAGIQNGSHAFDSEAFERVREDLCGVLFGGGATAADSVPIAYFTDYRCPYCRVLSRLLRDIEDEAAGAVSVAWHEWPILGEASEQAARAALAARRQGAYAAFHARLMRSAFVPTPGFLERLSEQIGVDADRLLRDMQSASIAEEISETRALAALFRFPGTPGLIVGRTAVIGAIGEAELWGLIERERVDGPIDACADRSR